MGLSSLARGLAAGFLRLVGIALLVGIGVFYLRLGWFVGLVWLAMTIPAYLLTRRQLARVERRWLAVLVFVALYVAANMLAWTTLFDHRRLQRFEMEWQNRGRDNPYHQAEVILTFAQFSQHSVGVYSDDVAKYLATVKTRTIPVTFEVTRDLGCVRGFHEVQIGDLRQWKSVWGYARSSITTDRGPSPWDDPPWCP